MFTYKHEDAKTEIYLPEKRNMNEEMRFYGIEGPERTQNDLSTTNSVILIKIATTPSCLRGCTGYSDFVTLVYILQPSI